MFLINFYRKSVSIEKIRFKKVDQNEYSVWLFIYLKIQNEYSVWLFIFINY
jgi:hypothetical protein